jgi:hypothetical protein
MVSYNRNVWFSAANNEPKSGKRFSAELLETTCYRWRGYLTWCCSWRNTNIELMLTYMQMQGYAHSNKLHVYDAGYIKLREASLTNLTLALRENYLSPLFSFNHWKKFMDYR